MHETSQLPTEWSSKKAPVARGADITRSGRRAAALERGSSRLIKRAELAGVDITYLGIAPLFAEPRAYAGPRTDWIIAPATDSAETVVPAAELDKLHRLVHAGLEFPLVYVAHEIPKGRLASIGASAPAESLPAVLDPSTADRAVGPVPPPAADSVLAEQFGQSSQQLLRFMRSALPIAALIAAAPVVIAAAPLEAVGIATAALVAGLDPIVFGVIPASEPVAGQPAAWYILAQWAWSEAPELRPET